MSQYKIHKFDVNMAKDQDSLERFLNGLRGEVDSIVPNVRMKFFWVHGIDFLYVVEKLR